MLRHLSAVLAVSVSVGFAKASEPDDFKIVEQLGAPSYRLREAASHQLATRGSAVLDLLQRSAKLHHDPEVRRRAEALARRIRRDVDRRELIPVRTLALNYDQVPLITAIADLKARTGIPIELELERVKNPLRTITVRSEPVPIWQAIEVFRQSAGLIEVFRPELPQPKPLTPPPPPVHQRTAYSLTTPPAPATPETVPLLFRDGTGEALPGDRTGGVRIVAVPGSFSGNRTIRGAGQVLIHLDVAPVPGLRWHGDVSVRLLKAEDETGHALALSYRKNDAANTNPVFNSQVFLGGPGQVVFLDSPGYSGQMTPQPNPRLVPVMLKTDDRVIRMLTVFEGVVCGEITRTNQTILSIPELVKAIGHELSGPQGLKVTVLDLRPEVTGQTVLKIRIENPNPWTQMQLGRRQQLLMNAWNADWTGDASAFGLGNHYIYRDAMGHILTPQTRRSSSTDDGIRQINEMELLFPYRTDYGPPTQLQLTGSKQVPIEIPFQLKNVPLR